MGNGLSDLDGNFELEAYDPSIGRIVVATDPSEKYAGVAEVLAGEQAKSSAVIVLRPAAIVGGRVIEDDRRPAPHQIVTAWETIDAGQGPTMIFLNITRTDNDGQYELKGLPGDEAGEIHVNAFPEGFGSRTLERIPCNVNGLKSGEKRIDVNLKITKTETTIRVEPDTP